MVDYYEKLQKSSLAMDGRSNHCRGVAHSNRSDSPCLLRNNFVINFIPNEGSHHAAGDLIPLTPISALTSLNATIKIDIYKVPQGTYIVVNSLFPLCIKPADSKATAALDEMNPQSLMSMLTNSEVARGKLVEEKLVNGVPVKHYVIDGDAFLSAAQQSKDPKLNAFGKALWAAKDADLYVDGKSGYPLAFVGGFSGSYDPLQFKGDFDVQIELTGINTNTPVNLPASCNKPITP